MANFTPVLILYSEKNERKKIHIPRLEETGIVAHTKKVTFGLVSAKFAR